MAIEKQILGEYVTVVPDGTLEYRIHYTIIEDGAEIAQRNHRTTFPPTAVIANLPTLRLRRVAAAVWTAQVIADYQAKVAANAQS
jgi:hypothetical protein